MTTENNIFKIMYMNTYGQSKLTNDKQIQIEDLLRLYNCDILHLQETHIDDSTFNNCSFLTNNYTVISNNSPSHYGTASLVKNDYSVENISFDTEGRVLCFNINSMTFCNVYLVA